MSERGFVGGEGERRPCTCGVGYPTKIDGDKGDVRTLSAITFCNPFIDSKPQHLRWPVGHVHVGRVDVIDRQKLAETDDGREEVADPIRSLNLQSPASMKGYESVLWLPLLLPAIQRMDLQRYSLRNYTRRLRAMRKGIILARISPTCLPSATICRAAAPPAHNPRRILCVVHSMPPAFRTKANTLPEQNASSKLPRTRRKMPLLPLRWFVAASKGAVCPHTPYSKLDTSH